MVTKLIERLGGHRRVKIIDDPYRKKDEGMGRRCSLIILTILTILLILSVLFIPFSLITFIPLNVSLILFLIFITKRLGGQLPIWGPRKIFPKLMP